MILVKMQKMNIKIESMKNDEIENNEEDNNKITKFNNHQMKLFNLKKL